MLGICLPYEMLLESSSGGLTAKPSSNSSQVCFGAAVGMIDFGNVDAAIHQAARSRIWRSNACDLKMRFWA